MLPLLYEGGKHIWEHVMDAYILKLADRRIELRHVKGINQEKNVKKRKRLRRMQKYKIRCFSTKYDPLQNAICRNGTITYYENERKNKPPVNSTN